MNEFYEKVEKVFKLAMRVNIGTEHDVFVEYSAHIKALSIRVFKDGWISNADPDYMFDTLGAQTIEELDEIMYNLKKYM